MCSHIWQEYRREEVGTRTVNGVTFYRVRVYYYCILCPATKSRLVEYS